MVLILSTDKAVRIFKQHSMFTKDPISHSFGLSRAITRIIPVQAHRARRQNLNPCFSKRCVHALEPVLYDELDRVFNKIDAHEQRGQEVPIQDLYHCYTVGRMTATCTCS